MNSKFTKVALLISVVLIVTALAYRFNAKNNTTSALVALPTIVPPNSLTSPSDVNALADASATPQAQLTNTDLVSRQLIGDYISLAASGKATDESVNALAEKYAGQIPSLSVSKTISITDLKAGGNSQSDYQAYGDQLKKIYTSYKDAATKAKASSTTGAPPTAALIKAFSQTASQLQNMPVPLELVNLHLQLVNLFLSSTAALEYMNEATTDPMTAFSGIITLNQDLDKEETVSKSIDMVLASHGVI